MMIIQFIKIIFDNLERINSAIKIDIQIVFKKKLLLVAHIDLISFYLTKIDEGVKKKVEREKVRVRETVSGGKQITLK
jgi:hypothetical protein